MPSKKETIQTKLTQTRQALLDTIQNIADEQWTNVVFAEESTWSVLDLLRHVTDAERGMTRLMQLIQQGGEGVPADFDLARWNKRIVEKTQHMTRADLTEQMTQNRQNLLAFIETVQEEDWAKKGRHGSGRIMSIEEICHIIADHETAHLAHIKLALG